MFHALETPRLGKRVSLRRPCSEEETLPHPIVSAFKDLLFPETKLALSTILPISKLSILYPVIMSGSLSLIRLVISLRIDFSFPENVWCERSPLPIFSTTAAAQRIVSFAIDVSKSNERTQNGAGNGLQSDTSDIVTSKQISTG